MSTLLALTRRNSKLFFKDKGMFFSALISPLILLVLYVTFLLNVFRESFAANLPEGMPNLDSLIDGTVGAQLMSSLLAVSCVTVSFCSNMLMVQDKANGARSDLLISPLKRSTLALGYYLATTLASLIICFVAAGVCLLYVANVGWYLSFTDVLLILLDILLLVTFGTALSSIINFFLSTEGQISAVGTIVSAGYGFICGAYMPISQFGGTLQKVLSFFPGTYGTSLMRNHTMQGAFREMSAQGFPPEVLKGIRDSVDANLYFFGEKVSIGVMYAVVAGTVAVLLGVYILLNCLHKRAKA